MKDHCFWTKEAFDNTDRAVKHVPDCVVIDTEKLWDLGQGLFLKKRGITYDRSAIKHLITGRSVREGALILQKAYGFHGEGEDLERERIETVRETMRNFAEFIPGFLSFFALRKDTYKTCIATSMTPTLLETVDAKLGLRKLFRNNVFDIERLGFPSKPSPDIFLYAARALGTDPDKAIVIEDSPLGVRAAKNAKMRCIALTSTYDREVLEESDYIVESFAKLSDRMTEIFAPPANSSPPAPR